MLENLFPTRISSDPRHCLEEIQLIVHNLGFQFTKNRKLIGESYRKLIVKS